MNAENNGYSRCPKHPSQFFTGFCSSCLAERLLSVDAGETVVNPQSEIVEVSCSGSDAANKSSEIRVRRTLRYLFELDDNQNKENHQPEIHEVDVVNENIGRDSKVSDSCDVVMSVNADAHVGRNSPFWSSLISSKKHELAKKSVCQRSWCGGFGGKQVGKKPNVRHSFDWVDAYDSSKHVWELPRHSWDDSVMGKALSCSFSCLDEPQDGSSRVKRGSAEQTPVAKMDNEDFGVKSMPLDGISFGESHREIAVPGVCRKKSNRWSRVWNWSITSPFRDFGKKPDHVLQRSLSESWRDSRKEKNTRITETDARLKSFRNGFSSARMNQFMSRSVNAVNGDVQNIRPDWQKKREFKLSRSRSVHYSSPGNLDNGLLRFYLTPLRSSRTYTRRSRTRTSRTFARGVLGL